VAGDDSGYSNVSEKWFKKYDWFVDFFHDAKEAIPPQMPEARGHSVVIMCFVGANYAEDVVD